MARGRPPKPLERTAALAKGDGQSPGHRTTLATTTKRPTTTLQARVVPLCPDTLSDRGIQEWDKIWTAGHWLHESEDYHWVSMIAQAYDQIAEFRDQVKTDGLVVEGYAGQVTAHPLIAEIRKAESLIMKCLSTLGFSPTDRARLGLTEAKAQNALMDLMDRTKRQ